ncbi:Oligopeptide transporter 5 [Ananas comosus]|uniref:Oligopeptide transporter 5 n=1 Tax=Ananas comosus TaxID=4615 RepID=A0A199VGM5_ANACO|nr:Oligopeptide transporter 5 [Ananas comosus]
MRNSSCSRRAEEEINDSPIEEVRHIVSIADDPSQPVLTFRVWAVGILSCVMLAFINEFFSYRQNQLGIGTICVQIVSLPIGRFMAATLPTKPVKVPLTNWSFSFNPGPFNLKEHVLITIFAGAGASSVYALNIVAIVKAFYHRGLHPMAAMLLTQTTQLLGYGWAGLFRKYLVDSPYMWWPINLVQVSLFRALNEEEKRPKGRLSRLQFFLIVLTSSFAYYIVPSYFFPALSCLSVACWIWKDSVTAHQIGSGLRGLGIGSFALDWNTVAGFMGNPLATPAFAIINTLAGFFLMMYVITPIAYWQNAFNARHFPFFSNRVFDHFGKQYNTTRILDESTFSLDLAEYDSYSRINLSITFAYTYGFGFAGLMATLSHVALFHGRSIWEMWRRTTEKVSENFGDVHTRLMKKNYKAVPQWWFHLLLLVVLGLSLFACEGFNRQLQLPYWGLFLAMALALIFTLPVGVITATTNQQPGLNIITELIIGYLYPGKPLANVVFKTYGYISMAQALTFLADFKLGHYMKIPPRSMFFAQLVGTVVGSTVHFSTAWWLLTTVKGICDVDNLPKGSPWTCPGDDVFYNASIIWGVVGPLRMFGRLGNYWKMNYFFLIGTLAPVPVWFLARCFPDKKWIRLINMPIILGGASIMFPTRAVNVIMWGFTGLIFNYTIYRRYKGWWMRHTYVLAAGLDAGIAFMGVLTFIALGSFNIYGLDWWGGVQDDYCPLATCPTAPGFTAPGCPLVQ